MADAELWTVERANAALPRVEAALLRIRDLVAEARRERDDMAGLREGNGHPATPRGAGGRRAGGRRARGAAACRARVAAGRRYLLCWVLGEPAVEWWHWPDTGFAGRGGPCGPARRGHDPPPSPRAAHARARR